MYSVKWFLEFSYPTSFFFLCVAVVVRWPWWWLPPSSDGFSRWLQIPFLLLLWIQEEVSETTGVGMLYFFYVCVWLICSQLPRPKVFSSMMGQTNQIAYYNLLWLCDEAKWRKSLCQKNFKTSVQDYHKSEISVDFQLEIDFSEWYKDANIFRNNVSCMWVILYT